MGNQSPPGRMLEVGSARGAVVASRLRGSTRVGGFAALIRMAMAKEKGAAVLIPGGK